jgi:hypothetical protein
MMLLLRIKTTTMDDEDDNQYVFVSPGLWCWTLRRSSGRRTCPWRRCQLTAASSSVTRSSHG